MFLLSLEVTEFVQNFSSYVGIASGCLSHADIGFLLLPLLFARKKEH